MNISARQSGEYWTLTFQREFRQPPEKVWRALTDPAQVGKWAPFITDDDLGTTGRAVLVMVDGETREPLPATIRVADRPSVLEYTWGDDVLRWELTPTPDGGTRLSLHHTMEDRDLLPKVAAGWHLCLDVAEKILDGEDVEPIRGHDALNHGWQELNDQYARILHSGG